MARIENVCKEDCSSCELLAQGMVDMVPCVLDQIFRRVQRIEKRILTLEKSMKIDDNAEYNFANNAENVEEETEKTDEEEEE